MKKIEANARLHMSSMLSMVKLTYGLSFALKVVAKNSKNEIFANPGLSNPPNLPQQDKLALIIKRHSKAKWDIHFLGIFSGIRSKFQRWILVVQWFLFFIHSLFWWKLHDKSKISKRNVFLPEILQLEKSPLVQDCRMGHSRILVARSLRL